LALFDDRKYVVQRYDLELGYKISTNQTICYVKRHPEENPFLGWISNQINYGVAIAGFLFGDILYFYKFYKLKKLD